MKFKILIVDDEEAARYGIRKALNFRDYLLLEAKDIASAERAIESEKPDLVLLDINLPDGSGMDLLRKLARRSEIPRFIVITAYGSERVAIEAIKSGAEDYLSKPFEVEELRLRVHNALEKLALKRENRRLRDQLVSGDRYGQLVGTSSAMRKVFDLIERVAGTDVTVLIEGESGTGKELVAREIHRRSPRADKPFVAMNCAALPETLIESELFGHEKGAFTGATTQRKGKFELADAGTLFLDEIGDMSLTTQAKVLRAIEEKRFERLGGDKPISVDVRIISATHKDLASEIQKGNFREDLYYRLRVVSIQLPPLRKRREDIPLLVNHFSENLAAKHGFNRVVFTKDAISRLTEYDWPGNVRELRNFIERTLVLARKEEIGVNDLPLDILQQPEVATVIRGGGSGSDRFKGMTYEEAKAAFEKEYLTTILEENKGNLSKAAEAMGIHRQTLQYKLKQLGIRRRWGPK